MSKTLKKVLTLLKVCNFAASKSGKIFKTMHKDNLFGEFYHIKLFVEIPVVRVKAKKIWENICAKIVLKINVCNTHLVEYTLRL